MSAHSPSPQDPPSANLFARAGGEDARPGPAHWQDLLGQLGRELAEPLTAALERVTTLTTTGRIDRAGLRALRDEVDRARQAGIRCQQIARLASGRIRQSHERVHLTNTVQSVLAYRAREMQARGLQLTQSLLPIEIQVDASMLFGLLNALVDWWLDCAQGIVELKVQTRHYPARAQLTSEFRHDHVATPADAATSDDGQAKVETLNWHLLEQTALAMGLTVERLHDKGRTRLCLEFPGAIQPVLHDSEAVGNDHGFADSVNSKPLAGSHVLVVAAQRDIRLEAREAFKSMGLVLDFVSSVREAAQFCQEGLPHAIVFEGALRSAGFDRLVSGIRDEVPEFVFIELIEEGRSFDISTISATGMARVGRDGIATALPSALVYELSRVM